MNSYDRDRAERQRKHQPCQASQLLCLIPACVSSFQKVKKGFATCAPPFTNTYPLLKTAAYTSRFFFFMSLAEWKPKLSLPVTRSQRATSRPTHREKLNLNFSRSSFLIRVNPLHPLPSLFLYGLLISLWYCTNIFTGFLQSKGNFVGCQNTAIEALFMTAHITATNDYCQ